MKRSSIALPQQYQTYAHGAGKRQFAENLAQLIILSDEAEKRHLDGQPKVQEQLKFQRENLLAQAMFEDLQAPSKSRFPRAAILRRA